MARRAYGLSGAAASRAGTLGRAAAHRATHGGARLGDALEAHALGLHADHDLDDAADDHQNRADRQRDEQVGGVAGQDQSGRMMSLRPGNGSTPISDAELSSEHNCSF